MPSSETRTSRYSFFSHSECEYFPCHKGIDPAKFNCLFCYCPLYILGARCGGSFRYNERGLKVCTNCTFPHEPENYARIVARLREFLPHLPKDPMWKEEQGK